MGDLIMERWKLFVEAEEGNGKGRTSQYRGSPLEKNGSSVETNEKNKRKRQKKVAMMGLDAETLGTSPHDLDEEKKKRKKKNCSPGNPVHKKEDGKFGKSTDAGSWSIDYGGSGNEPCDRGVLRKPSTSQHKVWTKADDCGRRGKFKCGTKGEKRSPWTEGIREVDGVEGYMRGVILEVLLEYEDWLKGQEGVLEEDGTDLAAVCRKKYGLMSLKDFLLVQQRMVASSKGDLFKQKKD